MTGRAPLRAKAAIALGLLLLVVAVFHPVHDHAFLNYDDPLYVTDNPMLRGDLAWSGIARAFRPYENNWIPLTWISLQLDHAFYGKDPAGYHWTNVALHAIGSLLLFAALARSTGAVWRSAFVAAVFAVHPLHVESVAWASERKDVLSGVFWMLGLWCWAVYAERPAASRMAAVAACLTLGLLAKPMLVTLPFALLLLDYWPLGRLFRRSGSARPDPGRLRSALIEKWPLFALVAAVSAVTFVVQRETGAMSLDKPFGFRVANGIDSYAVYLLQSVWPAGLAVFYPHPLGTIPLWRTAALFAGLAAVTLLALLAARTRPYLTVGWLWYLGTLVPVIGLVQVGMQAHADRYMYVPLIGLSIALAWGVGEWADASAGAGTRRPRRVAAGVAAGLAIAALSFTAWHQVGTWRDTTALFAHAVEVTERNFLAHYELANALLAQERIDEAEPHFAEARRLKPRWAGAHSGLGDVLLRRGDVAGAISAYERALELAPRNARTRANLGNALIDAGRSDEAVAELRRALRNSDDDLRAEVLALLASALAAGGQLEQAIDHYRRALEREPDYAEARANLGFALIRIGSIAAAQRELERAAELGVSGVDLHLGLAEGARQLGRPTQAVRHYREALALAPGSLTAANNLGWMLATHPDAAVRNPAEALRIVERVTAATGASEPALLDTLAAAQAAANRTAEAAQTAAHAAELARARGDAAMAHQIETRRKLYEAGRPYVEPTP